MEADILFHFASLDEPSGRLALRDFAKVLDPSWRSPDEVDEARSATLAKNTPQQMLGRVIESGYNFMLGSVAGIEAVYSHDAAISGQKSSCRSTPMPGAVM